MTCSGREGGMVDDLTRLEPARVMGNNLVTSWEREGGTFFWNLKMMTY